MQGKKRRQQNSCRSDLHLIPTAHLALQGDDCRDAGGRATQGAVAEVASEAAGEGFSAEEDED
jgi:hypothetical protein